MRLEDVRCPAIKGLPDDIYHVLHHSFVDIVKMRRSIESSDAVIDTSRKAVAESWDVLKRMRHAGFRHAALQFALPIRGDAVTS